MKTRRALVCRASLLTVLSLVASITVIEGGMAIFGADAWGRFNECIGRIFSWIRLPHITGYFSWTWATVFVLQAGLPFATVWLYCRELLCKDVTTCEDIRNQWHVIDCRALSILISLPVIVLVSRLLLIVNVDSLIDGLGLEDGWAQRLVSESVMVALLGIPYAALAVCVEKIIRSARRGIGHRVDEEMSRAPEHN